MACAVVTARRRRRNISAQDQSNVDHRLRRVRARSDNAPPLAADHIDRPAVLLPKDLPMSPLALALPLLLATTSSEEFDAMKSKSKEVESLGKVLSYIVGECNSDDMGERYDCQENMKKASKTWKGKQVYVYLGAAEKGALRWEGERGNGKSRMIWFPIYDAGRGLALTVGMPTKVNSRGNLEIRPTLIDSTLPGSVMASDLKRGVRTQNIAIEIIGSFGKAWNKKGKKGVSFKLKAVRLINARNGKTLMVASY
jgi:hypothetical protein